MFLAPTKSLDASVVFSLACATVGEWFQSQLRSRECTIHPSLGTMTGTRYNRYSVMVIIDGAHALGQIPLDVDELGADFWVVRTARLAYLSTH